MSTKILLFIFLISVFSCTKKQTPQRIDSLKEFKESIIAETIKKVPIIPDSVLLLAQHYKTVDSLSNDSVFYYQLHQIIAQCKLYQGDTDSCLIYLYDCYDFFKKDSSENGIRNQAKLNYNIGVLHEQVGNKAKALEHYNKVILMPKTPLIYQALILSHLNKSKILMDEDKYDLAIDAVESGISLSSKYKDTALIISSLQSYADVYTNCGFFDEAVLQFEEVLKYESYFTPYSKFTHHNNKGRMHFLQCNYAEAKNEFMIAFDIAKEDNLLGQYISGMNIFELSLLQHDFALMNEFYQLLETYSALGKNIPAFTFNHNSLRGEYFNQTNKLSEAERFFATADTILEHNTIDHVLQKLHYQREANFYYKIGKFKAAYHALQKYNDINKNILQSDNKRQVSALKYKYQRDTTLISQQNALKIQEEKLTIYKSRQIILAFATFSLLIILLGTYLYFRKTKQLHIEKEMRQIAALKMESIRGRLSPHLVFNALNSIWDNIEEKEVAKHKFESLMRLIRQSLVNTEQLAISLKDEINFVKSYISLQTFKSENELKVDWKILTETENQMVPGMILQIPVENAIKHGLANQNKERLLKIEISKDSEYLNLHVQDNGIGIKPINSIAKGTGTGLKVLTNTIHLLNQSNDSKISFSIENSNDKTFNGTTVFIKIPLKFNYELT